MKRWDIGIAIDGYFVQVELKKKGDVYYAHANSFFLVATTGDTEEECLDRLRKVFLRIREFVFTELLKELEIEKAKV